METKHAIGNHEYISNILSQNKISKYTQNVNLFNIMIKILIDTFITENSPQFKTLNFQVK